MASSRKRSVSSATPKSTDITPAVKHCLERLTENNEALNARLAKLGSSANVKDRDKRIAHDVVLEMYTAVSTKCQLGTYSGNMMIHLVDGVDQLESVISKIRSENRKSLRSNREMKAATTYIINRIGELENILSATREASAFWKFMYQLTQQEYNLTQALDEQSIWEGSRQYDKKWLAEMAGPFELAMQAIMVAIVPSLIKDAMTMTSNLPKPEEEGLATYATTLEKIAARCYEKNFFTESEDLMNSVLSIRKTVYGTTDPIIACSLNCLALIYSKMKSIDKATKANADALAIVEQNQKISNNISATAQQYERTGSLLIHFDKAADGIKLMKIAVSKLNGCLPTCEMQFSKTIGRLTRACNDLKLHDDAISAACQLIDYFHEQTYGSANDKNPSIYSVAFAMQQAVNKSKSAKTPATAAASQQTMIALLSKVPRPVSLPPAVESTLIELAVACASRYESKAANVIKDYVEHCKPLRTTGFNETSKRRMTMLGAGTSKK